MKYEVVRGFYVDSLLDIMEKLETVKNADPDLVNRALVQDLVEKKFVKKIDKFCKDVLDKLFLNSTISQEELQKVFGSSCEIVVSSQNKQTEMERYIYKYYGCNSKLFKRRIAEFSEKVAKISPENIVCTEMFNRLTADDGKWLEMGREVYIGKPLYTALTYKRNFKEMLDNLSERELQYIIFDINSMSDEEKGLLDTYMTRKILELTSNGKSKKKDDLAKICEAWILRLENSNQM